MKRSVPRSALGDWTPPADRNVEAILTAQERMRLPELVPLRRKRMSQSPFAFYRGGAAIMAADLATLPLTGIRVQACGDAHLSNFGAYGSPERNVVFDVNDFDETVRGAWEWDVLRLAASFELLARGTLGRKRSAPVVAAFAATYRTEMAQLAKRSPLTVWYQHVALVNVAQGATRLPPRELARIFAEARGRTAERLLARLTDGRGRFRDQKPTLQRIGLEGDESQRLQAALEAYRATLPPAVEALLARFSLRDFALKVVGVGSVGTRCYAALSFTSRGDPLLLQIKEAGTSVWEPYGGSAVGAHHGRRVVEGQRAMQAVSDVFLGWTSSGGIDYYVRQLRDMKDSFDVSSLAPNALIRYARLCAWCLAHAHARTGSPDELAAYLGKGTAFDRSLATFARNYADLTEADYRAFVNASA